MPHRVALFSLLLVTLTVSDTRAAKPTPPDAKVDYAALAAQQQWQWPAEEPGLLSSLQHYQGFHEATIVRNPYASSLKLKIAASPRQRMEVWAYAHSVFVGWADRVYFVDYSPTRTGGYLRTYDLREDRWTWQVELPKLKVMADDRAPLPRQRAHLELYRDVLMLWRQTNAEKVVEIISRADGKTLGRKTFAADTPAVAPGTSPRPAAQPDIVSSRPLEFGKWTYRTMIEKAHSRSRRSVGILSFDGKALSAEKENRFLWTPWGLMQSHGMGRFQCGWWPHYGSVAEEDINLSKSPDPMTSDRVRRRWGTLSSDMDSFSLTMEALPASPHWPTVVMSVAPKQEASRPNRLLERIDKPVAWKMLHVLAATGILAAATEGMADYELPAGQHYAIRIAAGEEKPLVLSSLIKADVPLYECVHGLHTAVGANHRRPVTGPSVILAACEPHLEQWRKNRWRRQAEDAAKP